MLNIYVSQGLFLAGIIVLLLLFGTIFWINRRQCKKYARRADRIEKWHHTLIENTGDAIIVLNLQGKSLYTSPSIQKVLGYTMEEMLDIDLLSISCPEDATETQKVIEQVLANPGVPIKVHPGRMLHKDGTWHWYEAVVTNMLHDPDIGGIVDNLRDVTDQIRAEEKLVSANRLYAFISQINQAIIHADSEQAIFKDACSIAVDSGKFQMAWIGFINQADKTITLTESAGMPAEDQPKFTNAAYHDHGGVGYLLRTGTPFICNDIERDYTDFPAWQAYGALRNLQSFIMLPIKRAGKIVGALSLYSGKKHLFDHQEVRLLEEVAGDISFAMDVLEKEAQHEKADKKMRHSELRLKEAQAVAHVGSWEVDFATSIAVWSDEALRIYGLSTDDNHQSYASWLAFIHPDDMEFALAKIKESQESLSSSAFYHRIICKDGTVRYIYSKTEFDFKDGKPVGLHGVCHDVTDIHKSEQAREQSDSNLLFIIDLIPQSIFVRNAEGKYKFVNNSFAASYGLTPRQLMHKANNNEIKTADIFLAHDKEVIATGVTKTIPELIFTDTNGNVRVFYEVRVPYTIPGTNEKAVLGIALDITEQRAINANLQQRNKDLEQFSYIISHNLRAPVANILGLAEVLHNTDITKEDEQALIKNIKLSVNKLDLVINDLNYILEFKNQDNQQKEWVNFSSLLADIQLSLAGNRENADVQIIGEFDGAAGMHTVKSYLYSIFYNLISNSIKYCKPGVAAVINVNSSSIDNKVQLNFKDNGIGIDLHTKGHQIFGLYKRFHFHVDGKGMGLYMVKNQVEALNGKITVNSEVDKGTEFKIEFEA